jgi:hypothetical protein
VHRATLKATNVKQCLADELPALIAFYRPKAVFTNDDMFELEMSFAASRKQILDCFTSLTIDEKGVALRRRARCLSP